MTFLTAGELANHIDCIGTRIVTYPMGAWEGGECTVTDLVDDDDLISFNVKRDRDGEEMGVFHYEKVMILDENDYNA